MAEKMESKKQYALIGSPLGHSLSPLLHRLLMQKAGTDGEYGLLEVTADHLPSVYEATLKHLNGFNVTIPHKTNMIPLLDELDERAALFGAVNTVAVQNGRTKGYNTDCTGFLRSLEGAGIPLAGRVLVTGCGGVSRMFAFESVLHGAAVTLAVRGTSLDKAQRLQTEIAKKTGKAVDMILLDEVRGGYDLIINGTPVGMSPHIEECPLSEGAVKTSRAVFDAIYNPAETRLLQYAREAGLPRVNGLPMLVWQAAAAQEIWNGAHFEQQEMNGILAAVQKELEHRA